MECQKEGGNKFPLPLILLIWGNLTEVSPRTRSPGCLDLYYQITARDRIGCPVVQLLGIIVRQVGLLEYNGPVFVVLADREYNMLGLHTMIVLTLPDQESPDGRPHL